MGECVKRANERQLMRCLESSSEVGEDLVEAGQRLVVFREKKAGEAAPTRGQMLIFNVNNNFPFNKAWYAVVLYTYETVIALNGK